MAILSKWRVAGYHMPCCSAELVKAQLFLGCNCITVNNVTGSVFVNVFILAEISTRQSTEDCDVYLLVPNNVHAIDEFLCEKNFNRTGTLCGKCKADH